MRKLSSLGAIIIAIVICLMAVSCTKEKQKEKIRYDINIELKEGAIEGNEKLTYRNVYKEGLGESVLHLYANAYREDAENPGYSEKPVTYGGMEIEKVTDNEGAELAYEISENREYLTVKHNEIKLGDDVTINIEFITTIPSGKTRLAMKENDCYLSGFYPQLSCYGENGFRKDAFCLVGDPIMSSASDYNVTFDCPKNMVVCASGKCLETITSEDRQVLKYHVEKIRDFAFALSPDYNVLQGMADEVEVYYFYKNDEQAQAVLETAINAIKVFGNAFGGYPYTSFTIARTNLSAEGMEYGGTVHISENCADVTETVLHKTAHQWWYGIVGNDPINESYMDEGLATFCSAYYYVLTGDTEKYENSIAEKKRAYTSYEKLQKKRKTDAKLSMDKPIYDFSEYGYSMVEYCKACLMFENLYTLFGKEKFNKCLKTYREENEFGFGGKDAFISVAQKELGDVSGLIKGWIGEQVVTTTFAEN